MESWYLRRKGFPETNYHLNTLLGLKEKLIVGRKKGGTIDIVCNGQTVSRDHCALLYIGGYWHVKDLKSMNGVFINKSKIPVNELTRLEFGDEFGVGAMDFTDPSYFVFDVCKKLVKDENQTNNHHFMTEQEFPIVNDSVASLSMASNKTKEVTSNLDCAGSSQMTTHIKKAGQNTSQITDDKPSSSTGVSQQHQLSDLKLSDPKLQMECRVAIERLSPIKCLNDRSAASRKNKVAPVKRRKRFYLMDSDEEGEDNKIIEVTSSSILNMSNRPGSFHDDDDDVIILSSDDDTFSVPRFRVEFLEPKQSTSNNRNDALMMANCQRDSEFSNASGDDAPFFPELSQGILREIEAEEEQEQKKAELEVKGPSCEKKRLEMLIESDRFKPKKKSTLFTPPNHISRTPSGKRNFQNDRKACEGPSGQHTEDDTHYQKNTPRSLQSTSQQRDASSHVTRRASVGASDRTAKDDALRTNYPKRIQRRSIQITSKVKRQPKKNSDLRSAMQHNCVPKGYALSNNQALKKSSSSSIHPVASNQAASSINHTRIPDLIPHPKPSKAINPSGHAAPVKAKITKQPRSAHLTADIVKSTERQLTEETDVSRSTSTPATTGQKRKFYNADITLAPVTALEESLSRQPPLKRIARSSPVDDDDDKTKKVPQPRGAHDRHQNSSIQLRSEFKLPRNKENNSITTGRRTSSLSSDLELSNQHLRPSTSHADQTRMENVTSLDRRILHRPTRKETHGKRVSFAEQDEIREFQTSSPELTQIPPKTVMQHVNVVQLMDDILLRICCWSFNRIAEQRQTKRDLSPPLLGEVIINNNWTLPNLSLLPVVSAYESLEAYFTIFHPLMLHEIWAKICQDVECYLHTWKIKIHSNPRSSGGCTIMQCETLVTNNSPRLKDFDLVTLKITLPKPQPPFKVFAVAENVTSRFLRNTPHIDQNLVASCRKADMQISFDLRIKPSHVPHQLKDKIFEMTSVSSLRPIIKQFLVNANLYSSPLCDVVLNPGKQAHAFKLDLIEVNGSDKLNPVQEKAVESITRSIINTEEDQPKVALLQGPPGTGKSHVIVELVLKMIFGYYEKKRLWPRILVCAPSNNAIDEIAIRLSQARDKMSSKFQIVRIGVSSAMHPGVAKISLDVLARKLHDQKIANKHSPVSSDIKLLEDRLKNLLATKRARVTLIGASNRSGNADEAALPRRELEDLDYQIESIKKNLTELKKNHEKHFSGEEREAKFRVVGQANVICSTLNSCRGKEMDAIFLNKKKNGPQEKKNNRFLCCIIDEASQCTEPESLTPLAFNISKLVMIGDPDQLPATVVSLCALENRFDQSLFNRFFDSRNAATGENYEPVLMLDTQYRMAEPICRWPSKYFYGGKLKTAAGLSRDGPCHSYRVLNVLDGVEVGDGKSMMNKSEAILIANMIKVITNAAATRSKSIGVITFYQKQRQTIQTSLREVLNKEADRIEVNTVDSFQGREKDIIIISCVRAQQHSNGDIGFIGSLNRMNVALTRAKESLIVCGHFPTLQKSEAWDDFISDAKSRPDVVHNVTSSFTLRFLKPLVLR